MARSLSFDLRSRVLAAIVVGLSCRQAVGRFGISVSSAIRWQALRRAGGDGRPRPQGGDRLSHRTDAHAGLIAAALADTPDITLPEPEGALGPARRHDQCDSALALLPPPQHHAPEKDGPRRRAGPAGHPDPTGGLV